MVCDSGLRPVFFMLSHRAPARALSTTLRFFRAGSACSGRNFDPHPSSFAKLCSVLWRQILSPSAFLGCNSCYSFSFDPSAAGWSPRPLTGIAHSGTIGRALFCVKSYNIPFFFSFSFCCARCEDAVSIFTHRIRPTTFWLSGRGPFPLLYLDPNFFFFDLSAQTLPTRAIVEFSYWSVLRASSGFMSFLLKIFLGGLLFLTAPPPASSREAALFSLYDLP